MKRQSKENPKKRLGVSAWFRNFGMQNKGLMVLASIILAATVLIGGVKYKSYLDRFSDKDYAAISVAAENIFIKIGGKDIAKNESCSYERPGEFDNIHLYCGVELATYLPYESDEQAAAVAKELEREIQGLGQPISHFSDFYQKPHNNVTAASVNLAKPLPDVQCHFTVYSNEKAKRAINFLPERTENNLIALSFECSAESKKEYFPVTYRQG